MVKVTYRIERNFGVLGRFGKNLFHSLGISTIPNQLEIGDRLICPRTFLVHWTGSSRSIHQCLEVELTVLTRNFLSVCSGILDGRPLFCPNLTVPL